MKRNKSKVYALIMSLCMMMSLCTGITLHAADSDPTIGSITVHKLKVKNAEDYEKMKEQGNGNFISKDDLPQGTQPMEGAQFKLEKVKETGDKLDVTTAEIDDSFQAITGETDAQGEYIFNNLNFGIYKLTELANSEAQTIMKPVLIQLPLYNEAYKSDPSKSEFLYDVHVYPKNLLHQDSPSISKDVKVEDNQHASFAYYEEFPWIIKTGIPADIASAKKYEITDVIDTQLDYVDAKEKVAYRKSGDTADKDVLLTKDVDYTLSYDSGSKKLTLAVTETGRQKLANAINGQVVFTFYTKLNSTAQLGVAIENKAKLDYVNADDKRYQPESETPEVHTGGINVKKVDLDDITKVLPGAKFKIYASEDEAKNQVNALQRDGKDYEVTTGVDGIASFVGLKYGDTGKDATTDELTYWLVETEAPTIGDVKYNRLRDPIKVTVNANSHELTASYTVKNAKTNYELPFTGGVGTIIFIAGGLALIGVALLLIKKDRKA